MTIGFYPGINSSSFSAVNGTTGAVGLATPGIDARQAFLTFGDASWGTVKMGRDIGLFGKDAILDDMTLLGVGSSGGNTAPGNTSLGRIGIGYIYTDWEPQITYTTPTFSGFSASAGVFQPLTPLGTPAYTKHTSPQIQIGASYAWGDAQSMTGKVWVDFVTQQMSATAAEALANGTGVATSVTGNAVDGGVKIGYAGFEGVVYAYTGSGVGTTGLYIFPTSASGSKRDSDGGYLQATYKIDKVKFGASYGVSNLKLASDEVSTGNRLVKRNESFVGGVYYGLTKSLTLVGEFIDTKATAWGGNSAKETTYALGAILFF